MMNIYARAFMIATMTDATESVAQEAKRRPFGWVRRARRWAGSQGQDRP
jgi:hypothetical protein